MYNWASDFNPEKGSTMRDFYLSNTRKIVEFKNGAISSAIYQWMIMLSVHAEHHFLIIQIIDKTDITMKC